MDPNIHMASHCDMKFGRFLALCLSTQLKTLGTGFHLRRGTTSMHQRLGDSVAVVHILYIRHSQSD